MSETNVQERSAVEPPKTWLSLEEQIELASKQLQEAVTTLAMAKVMAGEELAQAQRVFAEPLEPNPSQSASGYKSRSKVKLAQRKKIRPLKLLRDKLGDVASKVLSAEMLLPTKERQARIARKQEKYRQQRKAKLGNGKPHEET